MKPLHRTAGTGPETSRPRRDAGPVDGRPGPTDGAGTASHDAPAAPVIEVDAGWAGQRLDNYLMRCLRGTPKSLVYRWVRTGQVRVNAGRVRPDTRVAGGDRIRLPPLAAELLAGRGRQRAERADRVALDRTLAADWAGRIGLIHEDASLLVVDKPTGLAVHGGSGVASGLVEQLRALRPHERDLDLVHRLDRETSGLVMLARRPVALRALQAALAGRDVDKRYLAVVAGHWPGAGWTTLRAPLLRTLNARGERHVLVRPDGVPARTDVRVLRRFALPDAARRAGAAPATASLLECRLHTGRTHQIRVHLAHAGHPILGDPRYGDFALNHALERAGSHRMYLHAFRLRLAHPDTGLVLALEAPVPAAFSTLAGPTGPEPDDVTD